MVQIIEDLLDNDNAFSLDAWNIDDRDLPVFPNFYEFCLSKSGLYSKIYARQMWIAIHLLAEWCPICSPKRKSFRHIKKMPLDFDVRDIPEKVVLLEHGRCPSCGITKGKLIRKKLLHPYGELVAVIGQRAGKSSTLALIISYVIHKWLKLANPVETLGLLRNSLLTGTVVGLTYQKAVELMWTPIHTAMMQSEWFTEYHKLLDHHAKESGREVYKFRPSFIQYHHKNMFFSPSGPNKRTLRGNTRIWALIDELGQFPFGETKEHLEKANAEEVYTSLDNSLATLRGKTMRLIDKIPDMPIAYMLSISSPLSYWDKIMTLERTHRGSDDVLTCKLATWEFNPEMPKTDPFIRKKYRENPINAERDFAANPPMAAASWLSDISPVLSAATGRGTGNIKYKYDYVTSKSGQRHRFAIVQSCNRGRSENGRILALDAGHVNNSFGLAITEPIPKPLRGKDKEANDDRIFGARLVALAEVPPLRGESPINYTYLYKKFISPIIEEFNVKLILADRWQSIKLLYDAADDHNIFHQEYSLKPDDLSTVKDYLLDEDDPRIILPGLEMHYEDIITKVNSGNYPECFKYLPMSHLIYQFMVTNEDSNGMLAKGHGATDDLLRAAMLGLSFALNEDVVSELQLLVKSAKTTAGKGIVRMAGSGINLGALRPVATPGANISGGRIVSAGSRTSASTGTRRR